MKTLVLGDIHGRPYWQQIIEKENPDRVIFLGDYVTTHELYTPEMQLAELRAILNYKREHFDTTIILRGNHDLDGLGYYWARCYPVPGDAVRTQMLHTNPLGEEFLELSQWLHVETIGDHKVIFAHAGVTKEWMTQILKFDESIFGNPVALKEAIVSINEMEPSENFGFTGGRWDNYGTDPQQSCVWIRPDTLETHAVPGYDFVVGHTGTYGEVINRDIYKQVTLGGVDFPTMVKTGFKIWQCDALQQKAYLVIEDGEFYPRAL